MWVMCWSQAGDAFDGAEVGCVGMLLETGAVVEDDELRWFALLSMADATNCARGDTMGASANCALIF